MEEDRCETGDGEGVRWSVTGKEVEGVTEGGSG